MFPLPCKLIRKRVSRLSSSAAAGRKWCFGTHNRETLSRRFARDSVQRCVCVCVSRGFPALYITLNRAIFMLYKFIPAVLADWQFDPRVASARDNNEGHAVTDFIIFARAAHR